jgi:hypothetical protein
MSRAGVVMMAHGAAATNTIFQPHRSVFIEVFPYMRKRFGFMQAATAAGQFYYPIFSWEKVRSSRRVVPRGCASVVGAVVKRVCALTCGLMIVMQPWTGDASLNSTDFERDCGSVASIGTNHIRTCDLAQKLSRIRVPIDAFERILVDAFDTIGYRIDLNVEK